MDERTGEIGLGIANVLCVSHVLIYLKCNWFFPDLYCNFYLSGTVIKYILSWHSDLLYKLVCGSYTLRYLLGMSVPPFTDLDLYCFSDFSFRLFFMCHIGWVECFHIDSLCAKSLDSLH